MNEKWREVYTEEQIKKIQEIEMKNLRVITEVCEKLGIEFFLYGGSLIGAVRHKGFIPWDDDLDIGMLRDDYMRFVKEAPYLLPEEYYLQSPYNDKNSPYFYTKLRLKGTKYIEHCNYKLKIEQGIYVDIYPIDNMPDADDEFLEKYNRFQKNIRLFVWRQTPYSDEPEKTLKRRIRNTIKKCVCLCLRLIPHDYFVKKIDGIMTSDNDKVTTRKGNYSYFNPTNLFYDIHPYEKGIFEGVEVNLPKSWDAHLKSRYGDYMELPPEEERLGHKPYVLDFGKY